MKTLLVHGTFHSDGLSDEEVQRQLGQELDRTNVFSTSSYVQDGEAEWSVADRRLSTRDIPLLLGVASRSRIRGNIQATRCSFGDRDILKGSRLYISTKSSLITELDNTHGDDPKPDRILQDIACHPKITTLPYIDIQTDDNVLLVEYASSRITEREIEDVRTGTLATLSAVLKQCGISVKSTDWDVEQDTW